MVALFSTYKFSSMRFGVEGLHHKRCISGLIKSSLLSKPLHPLMLFSRGIRQAQRIDPQPHRLSPIILPDRKTSLYVYGCTIGNMK